MGRRARRRGSCRFSTRLRRRTLVTVPRLFRRLNGPRVSSRVRRRSSESSPPVCIPVGWPRPDWRRLVSLVERSPFPVEMEVPNERLPPELEGAAFFICSEALADIAK